MGRRRDLVLEAWCGREDSNFHGLSATAPSTLRVYQFRHDRIRGLGGGDLPAPDGDLPKPATGGKMVRMPDLANPEWRTSDDGPVPYLDALALMEERVAAIRAG